jgi:hypothetical protein
MASRITRVHDGRRNCGDHRQPVQGARERFGEQPAPDASGGDLAGEVGGGGAVADEFGGLVVGAEQGEVVITMWSAVCRE